MTHTIPPAAIIAILRGASRPGDLAIDITPGNPNRGGANNSTGEARNSGALANAKADAHRSSPGSLLLIECHANR